MSRLCDHIAAHACAAASMRATCVPRRRSRWRDRLRVLAGARAHGAPLDDQARLLVRRMA